MGSMESSEKKVFFDGSIVARSLSRRIDGKLLIWFAREDRVERVLSRVSLFERSCVLDALRLVGPW
jgi:hypothetical protein